MDKLVSVFKGLSEFILLFTIKYEYENRGLIKKMKIDSRLNLEIDDMRWCKLFLYKSCYNHCAKFILLKRLEDKGYIPPKINKLGKDKWNEFVKNISGDCSFLYSIAIKDLKSDTDTDIKNCFKDSDYDIFDIDNDLAIFLVNYFKEHDFSKFKIEDIKKIFQLIYPLEQREDFNLKNFYKKAPAFDYILKE